MAVNRPSIGPPYRRAKEPPREVARIGCGAFAEPIAMLSRMAWRVAPVL